LRLRNGQLSLDASRTTDPDGRIVAYDWYIELPDQEITMSGASANVTVPTDQPIQVTLVATDDQDATTYIDRNIVPIDVKPGSTENPINAGSNGVTPIAILSAGHFDATTVYPATVRVGPTGASIDNSHVEDVNGYGRSDLVVQVRTRELGLPVGTTDLQLTAALHDGTQFTGTDAIRVMK
jgi:hypothetical protein